MKYWLLIHFIITTTVLGYFIARNIRQADMQQSNIVLLESANYKYIIGARIKNKSEEIKQWILSLDKTEERFYETGKLLESRLIIGYFQKE